jgi:triosephosphate isomerase
MYKTRVETREFILKLRALVSRSTHCDVVVAPPFTGLETAIDATRGSSIAVGAQDVHWEKEGAFTGEVSAGMLAELGCEYVIVGHSERRQYFGETDQSVHKKTVAALEAGLTPITCLGETLREREANQTEAILDQQFTGAFAALTGQQFSRIIIAYEPVWAIGTGRTATPELAADAHRFLRGRVAQHFGQECAAQLRILYGGSVKPDNIKGLMAQVEIDGALVGGASLDPESFAAIVNF